MEGEQDPEGEQSLHSEADKEGGMTKKDKKEYAERARILSTLSLDVSLEELKRIEKYFPYILSEAVRELDGEVEYIMHELKDERTSGGYGKRTPKK